MIFYPFHYNASFHAWDILPCLLQFFSLSAQIFLKININFSEFIWQISIRSTQIVVETIFYPLHCDISFHAWDIQLCMFQLLFLPAKRCFKINIFSEFIRWLSIHNTHTHAIAFHVSHREHQRISDVGEFRASSTEMTYSV